MKTSVIMCAYTLERWDEMKISISSLHNQTQKADEIILVIDHNPSLLTKAQDKWPEVNVIANRFAKGLSGARNTGVRYASGDFILFIDEDAYASDTWIERLLEPYSDPKVLGVGGAIIPKWHSSEPAWFPNEFNWVVGCSYKGMPEVTQPVRNLIGCNMSFRRSAFTLAGEFTDGIGRIGKTPLGCEETELCIRINQKIPNTKLVYVPTAQVFHFVPDQRGNWRYFRQRCFAEGLSKAAISYLIGHQDATTTEKVYVRKVLPRGILNGLIGFFRKSKPSELSRAAFIVFGFATTLSGYVWGNICHLLNLSSIQLVQR